MRRKERERLSDGLRLKGWGKFFHGLFLFITFPIRKPLIFVPILMLAYLAPTFMGARPSEVHLWYWNKIKMHTQNMGNSISQKTQEMLPNVDKFKISMPDMSFLSDVEKEDNYAPKKEPYRPTREMFEVSKSAPSVVNALERAKKQQAEKTQNKEENIVVASQNQTSKSNKVKPQKQSKNKLPLVYTDNQEQITGTAEVINANELRINGKRYFLHGIYVNPTTDKGRQAEEFLRRIIAQNKITCTIIAYTYQNVGTIICEVNGENINRLLVNRGYSKNVDLQ